MAGAFTWACLEGTASSADNIWFAFLVDHLLQTVTCADHVGADEAWDVNLLRVLVEFAVVEAWAGGFLDTSTVHHDCTGWALATSVAVEAAWLWAW